MPTRKRPQSVVEITKTVLETADNPSKIELCFYIDADDVISKAALEFLRMRYGEQIKYTTSTEKLNLSQMWNYAYEHLSTGRLISLVGDDFRFRTKSWDTMVLNEFAKVDDNILLVYGRDGITDEKLAAHHFIHRDWVKIIGYWLPPYFCGDFVDTWLYDISVAIGRAKYLPDAYFEHMHFIVGKHAKDETHERRLQNINNERPWAIYAEKHSERQEQIRLLKAYIDGFAAGVANEKSKASAPA